MRRTNATATKVLFAAIAWVGFSVNSCVIAQNINASEASTKILLTATLDLRQPPFAGAVESITAEGNLRIRPYNGKPAATVPADGSVAEGLYLGVVRGVWKDMRDAKLVRVKVTGVMDDGIVVAEVGSGLDRTIQVGKLVFLVRPPRTTTAQMQMLPDLVTLERGPVPQAADTSRASDAKAKISSISEGDRAAKNLASIAKAIHQYEDTRGCFPPAALIGPDGRAWHSWRLLILPHFDDRTLRAIYDRYSLEEPWDGPNNSQLLATMPYVYSDYAEDIPVDKFTRFAAVTGPGTLFSAEGHEFDPANKPIRLPLGTRRRDIRDSVQSTLFIGTLGGTPPIPWLKPEDVVIGDEPSAIGEKGFFGAPYESERGKYALFARADGGLAGVTATIDPSDFRALLTIAGREEVDISKMPGAFLVPLPAPTDKGNTSPSKKVAPDQRMTIFIFEQDGVSKARFAK